MNLVMKMENGISTLDDILKAGKKFSCAELLYVLPKIVKAYAILEENGVACRDVKPANIIIVEDPKNQDQLINIEF